MSQILNEMNALCLSKTSNQLILGPQESANTVTISCATPGQATTLSIVDPGVASANLLLSAGAQSILTTTDSTSTSTGSLIVSGGVGIAKKLNVGSAMQNFATTNQLVMGATASSTTINAPANSSARIYSLYDTSNDCNIKLGIEKVVSLSASSTSQSLTISQSGALVFVPACSANVVLSIPAPTAGMFFRFILTASPNGSNTFTIQSTGANMKGVRTGVAGGLISTAASSVTNLILGSTAANAKPGDSVVITSDGTTTYYQSYTSGTADGFSTS